MCQDFEVKLYIIQFKSKKQKRYMVLSLWAGAQRKNFILVLGLALRAY